MTRCVVLLARLVGRKRCTVLVVGCLADPHPAGTRRRFRSTTRARPTMNVRTARCTRTTCSPCRNPRTAQPRVELADVLGGDILDPITHAKEISFPAVGTAAAKVNAFNGSAGDRKRTKRRECDGPRQPAAKATRNRVRRSVTATLSRRELRVQRPRLDSLRISVQIHRQLHGLTVATRGAEVRLTTTAPRARERLPAPGTHEYFNCDS
jgi:hypothetical protein